MTKKIIIGLLTACLLLIVGVIAFAQNVPSGNVRWEYTSISSTQSNTIQRANRLGQEGWELVMEGDVDDNSYNWIFKRRLP